MAPVCYNTYDCEVRIISILTTGVDMIEIARIRRCVSRDRFLKRVFGKKEYEELKSKRFCPQSAAACFAAKEAFGKALGTGIRGFTLSEVEILHDDKGCPYYHLSGNAEKLCLERGLTVSLSLTHTKEYALAFVTAYKTDLSSGGKQL